MKPMPENEFEKKVQDKMEAFRLQPSSQVWYEVEYRIREKKRRRVIIFLLLVPGLLLLGGGGWWLKKRPAEKLTAVKTVNAKTNNTTNTEIKNKATTALITNPNENIPATSTVTTKKEPWKTAQPAVAEMKTIKQLISISKGNEKKSSWQDETKRTYSTNSIAGKVKSKQKTRNEKDNSNTIITTPEVPVSVATEPVLIKSPVDNPVAAGSSNEKTAIAKPETVQKMDTVISVTAVAELSQKQKKPGKKKWEAGFTVSIGPDRLTDGNIAPFGEKALADAYSNSGGVASSPQVSFADSIPLKGMAWQAGVYAKRKLGKKTAVSAGLNFSYYSVKQRVGIFTDSVRMISNELNSVTTGGYYQAGGLTNYKNKYYFFQIPLLFHWQINKGRKLPPFEWENGLAFSFLAGSDAVVYDKYAHLFYKDKRVFNSFNLVYQSGFSVRFFEEKKHPLSAGFYYNYHISKLQKVNPPDYNHLSSFGIKINWVLKK